MCGTHYQMWREVMDNGIKGITPPPNAPDDWRPSIEDMIRHGEIMISFEKRNKRQAQVSQLENLRQLLRRYPQL